jgi:hypothetical protein
MSCSLERWKTSAISPALPGSIVVDAGTVRWVAVDGAIHERTNGRVIAERHGAVPGRRTIDVASDGRRLLWSDCGAAGCRLYANAAGVTSTLDLEEPPRDLIGDGATTYFISGERVLRYLAPHGGSRPRTES